MITGVNPKIETFFSKLKVKWKEIPLGLKTTATSNQILSLADDQLETLWEKSRKENITGKGFPVRGWYHLLYKEFIRGKRILDIGSGMGFDGVSFLDYGASYVGFADIVLSNIEVIDRILKIKGHKNYETIYLQSLSDLKEITPTFDVIMAIGSLHHSPDFVIKPEINMLKSKLRKGGRWLQLAYPKSRWVKEGSLPFETWGDHTDSSAPWTEWYDMEKLLSLLGHEAFQPVFSTEFHNNDFIWCDLVKI